MQLQSRAQDVVEDRMAVLIKSQLSHSCARLGRGDEALKWTNGGYELAKKFANQYGNVYLIAKLGLAWAYMSIDQAKEAAGLLEGVVDQYKTTQSKEFLFVYHQKAQNLYEDICGKCLSVYGDTNLDTLMSAAHLGFHYARTGRVDDGKKLLLGTIETGQRTGVSDEDLQ